MVLALFMYYHIANQRGCKYMERSEMKRIGQILKDRRLQLGYTQEFAAEKAGISYSYYTKIERGEQLPSLEVCLHLAKTFRLSLDSWLLDTLPDLKTSPEMAALFHHLKEMDSKSIHEVQLLLQKAALLAK